MTTDLQTGESLVTYTAQGQTLRATLRLPPGGPAPVFVFLHGFTGSRDKDDVLGTGQGVMGYAARLLSDAGYASLRLDFAGSGDSDGDYADTTFEAQIANGLQVLSDIAADPRVQGDRLALVGWSMGGMVAACVAARSAQPRVTALWAPVARPRYSFGTMTARARILRDPSAPDAAMTFDLDWTTVHLKQPFFDGVLALDPLVEIAGYGRPLFVAHGRRDEAIPYLAAQEYIAAHPGPNQIWLAEMDHGFNRTEGPQMLDAMVAAMLTYAAPYL